MLCRLSWNRVLATTSSLAFLKKTCCPCAKSEHQRSRRPQTCTRRLEEKVTREESKSNKLANNQTFETGIGFKSVFSICETPIVWSGEFRIGFDSTQLGGEISPTWVESLPDFVHLPEGDVFV
jgi:hypothetical protein